MALHPHRNVFIFIAACWSLLLGTACARPPAPDAETGTVWGYVSLVPKPGTESAGGGYADRRLATVKRVDYSRLVYAVVFASSDSGLDSASHPATLHVRGSSDSVRLAPAHSATSPSSGIRLVNETASLRIVSIPTASQLIRLEPGASQIVSALDAGEHVVHLLGEGVADAVEARVWIMGGLRAEVDPSGRYEVRGLAPGHHRLTAWHPRLPSSPDHVVDVARGGVHRIDIQIGVGLGPARPEVNP